MSTGVDASPGGGCFEKELQFSLRDYIGAAVVGLVLIVTILTFCRGTLWQLCEYPAIYNGARLLGTPYLYDTPHNQREQIKEIGAYGAHLSYVRLPFYAAIIWPLGRLPYRASLAAWELLNAIALILFVFLWTVTRKRVTWLACVWSVPVLLTFLLAEDDIWLLVIIALIFRWRDSKPTATGFIASLLSMKFHLFLLLPLPLIAQRRWGTLRGFAAGCTSLIAVSFAVAGLSWPAQLAHLLSSKAILPHEYLMPNVRGALSQFTDSLWPELLIAMLVAFIVFQIARRTDFEMGMAAMLVCSLLVSHHGGAEDCVLLIPALLILGDRGGWRPVLYCLILLSPICYIMLNFGGIASEVSVLAISSILAVIWSQRTNRRGTLIDASSPHL